MLGALWHDMANLFYPRLCCGCDTPLLKGENHLCLHCQTGLPLTDFETIRDNPMEHIFTGRVTISWATALLYFSKDSRVQHIVHHIKYKGHQELALYMGGMMGRSISDAGLTTDLIMPVPLHKNREKTRGYNQSSLLAEGLANVMGVPLDKTCLTRVKMTTTQTRKTRVERWENVGEAFHIKAPGNIMGKHILLVDDVITTGSTLEACAIKLLDAGAAAVAISTLGFATHW